jgi:serine/threonine protein kinase
MGVVYRAEQLDVHGRPLREVALKTLRGELSHDENFARRFLDEIRVVAQLRSTHVVTFYDVDTDENGQLYYTMEFVRGRTLKEWLQRQGSLPVARVIQVIDQICEALSEAHSLSHPIVHRDLKPANIFLEEHQKEARVKVGDFGIAKILGEQTARLTAVGTPGPGTPRYMAPEQWKGEELSNRTDLYALGAMMYELLAGRPPFAAQGGLETLMYQHLHETPPPLPTTIPAELRNLVEQLLAKDPQDRPQTAVLVRQTLEAVRLGRDEEATVIVEAKKPTKRKLRWAVVLLVAAVMLGVVLMDEAWLNREFWAGSYHRLTRRQEHTKEPEKKTPLSEQSTQTQQKEQTSRSLPVEEQPSVTPAPRVPQGGLQVQVNVDAARVSLNGEYVGTARRETPLELLKLAVGTQQVRVEADGYEVIEQTVTIQEHTPTKLQVALDRLLVSPAPSSSLPSTQDIPPPAPAPLQGQTALSPPEDEGAATVIFYGPDGKPIPRAQLEGRQKKTKKR